MALRITAHMLSYKCDIAGNLCDYPWPLIGRVRVKFSCLTYLEWHYLGLHTQVLVALDLADNPLDCSKGLSMLIN